MAEKIPSPVIGLLGEIFNEQYTHANIERIFVRADAPPGAPDGNKIQKTMDWLHRINKESSEPLRVLGVLLEELLEKPLWNSEDQDPWDTREEPSWSAILRKHQTRVRNALDSAGLVYSYGGHVGHASATPTASLMELISGGGISAVEVEMKRAIKQVNDDPNAAAHYAGNVLEAAFKAYLTNKNIQFNDERDTLSEVWRLTRDDLGLTPKNLEDNDLKKIASGLNSIVDGTMYLRNKKSGAHGRTEAQFREVSLRPRHARLVIHSAHTLAAYVLECLADAQPAQ